jgi:hypothetical protein
MRVRHGVDPEYRFDFKDGIGGKAVGGSSLYGGAKSLSDGHAYKLLCRGAGSAHEGCREVFSTSP